MLDTALEMAEAICSAGPLAVRTVRKLVRLTSEVPLEYGQRIAAQEIAAVWSSEDQREGMRSFLEKRPPVWTGR